VEKGCDLTKIKIISALFASLVLLILLSISGLVIYRLVELSAYREQLCFNLQIPVEEKYCRTNVTIHQAIDLRIHPGKTTRQEVNEHLINAESLTVGGIGEAYSFMTGLFGETYAYFTYDEQDVLISMTFED
jgi:hypothetical protein